METIKNVTRGGLVNGTFTAQRINFMSNYYMEIHVPGVATNEEIYGSLMLVSALEIKRITRTFAKVPRMNEGGLSTKYLILSFLKRRLLCK